MIYSKYSDINALLTKSYNSLIEIEEEYKKSLKNKQIDDILLVDIKNYFENLRSSLDYLWKKYQLNEVFQLKKMKMILN